MKTQAIIPAAGLGTRFNANCPKPLVLLRGKPIILYSLLAIEKSHLVENAILVVPKESIDVFQDFVAQYHLRKIKKIIPGGRSRFESVALGLKQVDQDTDIVLVHDGVRPLVTVDLIDRTIKACQTQQAVVVAVPVKATIKKIDRLQSVVQETLNREELWEIQTPQVFKKELILKAYAQASRDIPTDDASLVEKMGIPVGVLEGNYKNIKITTPEDLMVAETFLQQ